MIIAVDGPTASGKGTIAKALAVCAVIAPLLAACGSKLEVDAEQSAFKRVSVSASPIPFGKQGVAAATRLKPDGDLPCEGDFWSRCSLVDRNGVQHSLYDGRMVVKLIKPDKGQPVQALNIGNARSKAEVVKAINSFISPKTLSCIGIAEDECFALFGEASVKANFDRSGELKYVRLDDWVTP
jgi:hypothetical protein